MALAMVFGMETYNSLLISGRLFDSRFAIPAYKFLLLSAVVFVLQHFIGGPVARKAAFRIVIPQNDKPFVITFTMSVCTIMVMCPLMSLVAVVFFRGVDGAFFEKWIKTVAVNFPMAFFWQILIAGPLIRFLFRKIFARQIVQ